MANILILEDEEEFLVDIFSNYIISMIEGYELTSICHDKNPEKVVSELEEKLAGENVEKPDVIICDGLHEYWHDAYKIAKKHGIANFAVYSGSEDIVTKAKNLGLPAFIKLDENEALLDYLSNLQT